MQYDTITQHDSSTFTTYKPLVTNVAKQNCDTMVTITIRVYMCMYDKLKAIHKLFNVG